MKALLILLTFALCAQADRWTDAFSIENIAVPTNVDPQIGGLGTLPDQRLIACFHRGEVMIYDPANQKWSLFAQGLHEPLGLLVEDQNNILVMQRPELTRLTDTDGDGVADEYTTVFDNFGMTGNYHEFSFGPAKDHEGNLYIALGVASNGAGVRPEIRGEWQEIGISRERMQHGKNWPQHKKAAGRMYSRTPYRGWVIKISPDGTSTPYACGLRSPNGIGFDAHGNLLVTDNQGDWLGTSKLHYIQKDGFHGHPASLVWREGWTRDPLKIPVAELDQLRIPAAGLFPQGELANSPTQPITIPEGIFRGAFLHTLIGEMNQYTLVRFLPDPGLNNSSQGATIPFLQTMALGRGNNRLTFTQDGSLWVGKTHLSWPGSEGLLRIRQKSPEETLFLVDQCQLNTKGFTLHFSTPVAKKSLKDLTIKEHIYHYHVKYGSKKVNEATLPPSDVSLSPDGTLLTLKIPQVKEKYLYTIHLKNARSTTGKPLLGEKVYYHAVNAPPL